MKMMSKAIFGKGADSPLDGEVKYEGEIRYVAAGGEWFVVHGEVSPTAEECGSFEKLIKLFETKQSNDIIDDSIYALQTLVKSEYCPADVLHHIANKNIAMRINSAIAESPNVELETLNLLAKNANDRREWRSLTTGYRKVLAPEKNAIDFLKKSRTFECKSSESLLMEIAPVLTELLWQELALLGLLKFYYNYDIEGDQFGPIGLELDYTPAGYLLSPGFEAEWISNTDHVEFEYVAEMVEDQWEEWEEALCSIGALATGVSLGHLEPITQKTYDEILSEMSEMEGQFIDTDVEILPAKINAELQQKGITFAELDDSRKMELVQHLVNTIKHPYFGGFKISQHILSLLLMHPSTPSDAKALIALHSSQ
jgi:lambda repressor-like predicted transcriptional regulator